MTALISPSILSADFAALGKNPGTPVDVIDPLIDLVDMVLVMSVNPGFGGQSFIMSQLDKIRLLRKKIDASGRDIILEVDGGVNPETSQLCIEAGATSLVAGSAVFKGKGSYAENIAGQNVDVGIHGDPWTVMVPSPKYASWLHSFEWMNDLLAVDTKTKNKVIEKAAAIRTRSLVDSWVKHYGQWNSFSWDLFDRLLSNSTPRPLSL